MALREGPPVAYVPVLRVPWLFPFHAGAAGWKVSDDPRPICVITGERITRDGNTGERSPGVTEAQRELFAE